MIHSEAEGIQLEHPGLASDLLLLLLVATLLALGGSGNALALDATRAATTVRRGQREVDVLLGVKADNEGRHVDDLLSDTEKTRQSGSTFPHSQGCHTGCDAGG